MGERFSENKKEGGAKVEQKKRRGERQRKEREGTEKSKKWFGCVRQGKLRALGQAFQP